jgi:dienelactone hydrolase
MSTALILSTSALTAQHSILSDDKWIAAAKVFVTHIAEGRLDEAVAMLDDTMRESFDSYNLDETWKAVTNQVGDFRLFPSSRVEVDGEHHAVDLTCEFERAELIVRVVLDTNLSVAGLWFRPVEPPPYETPGYVDEEAFTEEKVKIQSGEITLPGTLTIPEGDGPFAGIVLVHGSGPHDRDETIGPNRPFKDLAWGLASKGVSVLRYDKRTYLGDIENAEAMTVNEEVIDDALAAARFLMADERVDNVFVLGHSLGGVLAPVMAKKIDDLSGIIMMAATARSLDEVMSDQLLYIRSLYPDLPEEKQAEFDSIMAKLTRLRRGDLPPEVMILGATAAYFSDLKAKRPVEQARKLTLPILILQGERDYQATMVDFKLWQSALREKHNVTMKAYPTLNHLFMEGEGRSTPEEYQTPGHVSEEAINDMVAWISLGHADDKAEPEPETEQAAPADEPQVESQTTPADEPEGQTQAAPGDGAEAEAQDHMN